MINDAMFTICSINFNVQVIKWRQSRLLKNCPSTYANIEILLVDLVTFQTTLAPLFKKKQN